MSGDMVKYYGPGGRRRGGYRLCKLGAWFSTVEFREKWGNDASSCSPAEDIGLYLKRAGRFVEGDDAGRGEYWCGLGVYHYGVATVALKYRFLKDVSGEKVAGNVSVNLVSNGLVEDVVDRLRKRFPYLKEGASVFDIPDF